MGEVSKRCQVDIESEAGKCMNVKETNARIGLAGKQAGY
jgi:hypothetical protein